MSNEEINKINEEAMKQNNQELNRNARSNDFKVNHVISNDQTEEEQDSKTTEQDSTEEAKRLSGQD